MMTFQPSNAFHAVRQYLLNKGIDTRIFSFTSIPLPMALTSQTSANADALVSVDNDFCFQLRRVYETDMLPVLADVILFRFVFEAKQDSNVFRVQATLHHVGHALYEMNLAQDEVIRFLTASGWECVKDANRILCYEKRFTGRQPFCAEFEQLYPILQKHDLLNRNLIPVEATM